MVRFLDCDSACLVKLGVVQGHMGMQLLATLGLGGTLLTRCMVVITTDFNHSIFTRKLA